MHHWHSITGPILWMSLAVGATPAAADPVPASGQDAPEAFSSGASDAAATSPEDLPSPRLVPSPARPEEEPEASDPGWQRSGWFLGGGLGMGSMGYENIFIASDGAAYCFDAYFGGMLTPRIALSVELWSDGHRAASSGSMAQDVLGMAARYWFTPKLWSKGGFGSATLVGDEIRWNGQESLDGISFLLSTGYELISKDSMALEVAVRVMTTGYEMPGWGAFRRTLLGAHLGFIWY